MSGTEEVTEIRRGRIGVLNIYEVSEEELSQLSQGDRASIYLNFALALAPFALALVFSLVTTDVKSDRVYYTFVIICAVCGLGALLSIVLYFLLRGETKKLARMIRERIPPASGIQEMLPES